MFRALTTVVTLTGCTVLGLGCQNGPSSGEVNRGIDDAFQAPGRIAGAAGSAGGNIAADAVETPGKAAEAGASSFDN